MPAVTVLFFMMRVPAAASYNAPFSLSLGVNFPNQTQAKDIGGSSQIAANVSYAITPTTRRAGSLYLFVDYTGGGNSGANEDAIGGGVGFRMNTPIYAGLDLGAYGTSVGFRTPEGSVSSGTTGGGGRAYVGGNLVSGSGPVLFLEGGYRFLPSVEGVDPSGWGVSLGARF